MSKETRQALNFALVAAICVAALTALASWSVMGMVFVALAHLAGLGVGWHLGVRHTQAEVDQAQPARRRLPGAGKTGGTKR